MKILEIIIATIVLVATTLMICKMNRGASLMSQDARANDAAYIVAEKKFTELSIQVFPVAIGVDTAFVNEAPYIRNWAISDTGHIRRAVVTVTWMSLGGSRSTNFSRGL
jgi:DNA mismatch repair protein MutH